MYVIKITQNHPYGCVTTHYYRDYFWGLLMAPIEECKHFDSREEAERVVNEVDWDKFKYDWTIEIVEV